MRKKRIIYMNDARHYYLFVFEPPMTLEEAWIPVDEVAGTAVDTFCYGVERGDGLFYPSKIGMRFGADIQPFEQAAYWRIWHNMQSLIDRGLDPLRVLIDRAHDKGMDFIASLRMPAHGGMDPAHRLQNDGRGLAHQAVRDHQFAVLEELATEYPIEALELDFAFPGGSPILRDEDAPTMRSILTEYIEQIAVMVRNHRGDSCDLGIRVLPTEEMNLAQGLDVRAWFKRGLVDFAVPMRYAYMILDPDMPIDWLIETAHRADASVYGILQPYVHDASTGAPQRIWPTPAQMRAAVANNWARDVDGLYTWFMRWPLGDVERSILTELGDPELVNERDKHYMVARNLQTKDDRTHYRTPLPLEIDASDIGTRHPIPFYVADDIVGSRDRIRQVRLKINITDLVSADRLDIWLNGKPLNEESCLRTYGSRITPYTSQWLEFRLKDVLPRQGQNLLKVVLEGRAQGLVSPLKVEHVELIVEYGPYPSVLKHPPPC